VELVVFARGYTLKGVDSLLKPDLATDETAGEGSALPLDSLDFVRVCSPTVDKARDTIIQEMESMVVNGLADLVCSEPLLEQSAIDEKFRINHYFRRRYRQHTTSDYYLILSPIFSTT